MTNFTDYKVRDISLADWGRKEIVHSFPTRRFSDHRKSVV